MTAPMTYTGHQVEVVAENCSTMCIYIVKNPLRVSSVFSVLFKEQQEQASAGNWEMNKSYQLQIAVKLLTGRWMHIKDRHSQQQQDFNTCT